MMDRISIYRPAAEGTGTFDETTLAYTDTPEVLIYSGEAMISNMAAGTPDNEGYLALVSTYKCRVPLSKSLVDLQQGDRVVINKVDRSDLKTMVGMSFNIIAETFGSFVASRSFVMTIREPRP